MLKYILKRLGLGIVTLFVLITITFFLTRLMPGNPFSSDNISATALTQLNSKYGLDKPLGQQYVQYLGNVLKLDFGDSINFRGRSVMSLVGEGFKTSGKIGLIAAMLAIVTGVVLGALAAIKRDTTLDKTILVLTTASVSLPNFVVAIILLWAFGVWWAILPTRGTDPGGLIMPVLALMLYPSAYITRLTRSSMLDVLGQDYIRTARAKGVHQKKVLFKHALKNALPPVVTYAGPMIAYIVTGSFVVEQIFSVPGLGKYFVSSIPMMRLSIAPKSPLPRFTSRILRSSISARKSTTG